MRRIFICVSLLICMSENAFAFDGQRSRFFLRVGIGPGLFDVERDGGDRRLGYKESGSTISSDFKIGVDVNKKILIYGSLKADWVSDSYTRMLGVGGIGLSCYLPESFWGALRRLFPGSSFLQSASSEIF